MASERHRDGQLKADSSVYSAAPEDVALTLAIPLVYGELRRNIWGDCPARHDYDGRLRNSGCSCRSTEKGQRVASNGVPAMRGEERRCEFLLPSSALQPHCCWGSSEGQRRVGTEENGGPSNHKRTLLELITGWSAFLCQTLQRICWCSQSRCSSAVDNTARDREREPSLGLELCYLKSWVAFAENRLAVTLIKMIRMLNRTKWFERIE